MAVSLLAAVLSATLILAVKGQLLIGEDCITKDGLAGTCKDPTLSECHDWVAQQVRDGNAPGICSWIKNKPIVCCSNRVVGGRLGILTDKARNSKSYQKCAEYADMFEESESIPVLTPTTTLSNHSDCPIGMDGNQLIIGGAQTVRNEFPHMAALGYGPIESVVWLCGGSLISERFVLTAAHCLFATGSGVVTWARLGDLNIYDSVDDSDTQMMAVLARHRHPNYTAKAHYYDIALLELDDDVTFSKAVRPACIHHLEGDTSEDLIALVTGWGKTNNWSPGSEVLMKAQVRFMNATKCSRYYTQLAKTKKLQRNIDSDTMVCARDPKGVMDTCQGDSGGPISLVLHEPTCMYVVVGVTSFGPSACAVGSTPAVYSKVGAFLPWIEPIVWTD